MVCPGCVPCNSPVLEADAMVGAGVLRLQVFGRSKVTFQDTGSTKPRDTKRHAARVQRSYFNSSGLVFREDGGIPR